jgi:DNA-binding NtrC family response regulator
MEARQLLLFRRDSRALDIEDLLRKSGWDLRVVQSIPAGVDLARQNECLVGVVVMDPSEAVNPADLESLVNSTSAEWVALVPRGYLSDPVWAKFLLENFYDYHTFPPDIDRLLTTLGHAYGKGHIRRKLSTPQQSVGRYGMIGKSTPMQRLYAKLDRIIKVDAPVLIVGESGTGKELVARAIHQHSPRKRGPFIPVNCGGLPDSLVHSELFGYERGAFTGAYQRKTGSIEAAEGGVIFLDEIGDLPLDLQANLLRFLQEKTIVRLGSTRRVSIDVRVIAATHVDLQSAVSEKRFREDLYYRLNVLRVDVPPLRERSGDIELLALEYFQAFAAEKSPAVRGYSQAALRAMREYLWPGNVRDLINRVQRAVIMSENRLMSPTDLGLPEPAVPEQLVTLRTVRANIEQDAIRRSLRKNANNISRAARELGVSRVTLYRLMDKFKIQPDRL